MPRRRPINLSRDAFRHLAAALGVAVLSTAAHADWTLLPADGTPSPNLTVNTWTPAEGLSATDKSGKLVRFPTRDIVSLTPARPPASLLAEARLSRWKLSLRNGDVLYGSPVGFSGQSFLFKVPEIAGGTGLSIPLKAIASLTNPKADPKALPPAAAADKDIVRFVNTNDQQGGIVANIDATKVQLALEGAEAPTDFPLDRVALIQFGGAASPRGVPPLSLRLTFASGTTCTIPAQEPATFNWSLNKITFKDTGDTEYALPSTYLTSVEVLGGRVLFLTELDPAAEEQVSLLGTRWPMQVNKNVLGQPLRVARTEYARGIGVHTQSSLVYTLDGSFETFSVQVGLDDSAAPQGEAIASVLLDGKTLWKSDTLHPGQVSPPLNLPIAGGKRLELRADPASRLDILGRVDWLNPALKRR
jgi:hypothetical protein